MTLCTHILPPVNLKCLSVVPDISVSLTNTPVSELHEEKHSLDQFWVLIREQVHMGTLRTQRCPTHSDPFCNYYFIYFYSFKFN